VENNEISVYTDGGSRGNPGPAACAFVIKSDNHTINKSSKYLGKATNNYAEYSGVVSALSWLKENELGLNLSRKTITFFLDSELVVKQINGQYKVKDENLRNLFFQVLEIIKSLGVNVNFCHVPRERNKSADLLVNQELDSKV
jgi:ribonuclease HI